MAPHSYSMARVHIDGMTCGKCVNYIQVNLLTLEVQVLYILYDTIHEFWIFLIFISLWKSLSILYRVEHIITCLEIEKLMINARLSISLTVSLSFLLSLNICSKAYFVRFPSKIFVFPFYFLIFVYLLI